MPTRRGFLGSLVGAAAAGAAAGSVSFVGERSTPYPSVRSGELMLLFTNGHVAVRRMERPYGDETELIIPTVIPGVTAFRPLSERMVDTRFRLVGPGPVFDSWVYEEV